MNPQIFRLIFIFALHASNVGGTASPVPSGFPSVWDGDKYFNERMTSSVGIPKWLDGYLFCPVAASYGDQSQPAGFKLSHMFDALPAVAK